MAFLFEFRSLIRTLAIAENTSVRKYNAKNLFFSLYFAHLFVSLSSEI